MKISIRFIKSFFRSLAYLSPIWVTLAGTIFALGILLARLERIPVQDGLYFAWVTALTVGYGDVVAVRPLARLCGLLIALIGMIFSGIWVAVAVQAVRMSFSSDPQTNAFFQHPPDSSS